MKVSPGITDISFSSLCVNDSIFIERSFFPAQNVYFHLVSETVENTLFSEYPRCGIFILFIASLFIFSS